MVRFQLSLGLDFDAPIESFGASGGGGSGGSQRIGCAP